MKPKLIFVIDDDDDVRAALRLILEDAGYRTDGAADGHQALELLRNLPEPPALILLDLMMPRMSGSEFREAQLRDSTLSRVPVVILSADTEPEVRAQALRVAVSLRKPLDIETLLDAVDSFATAP